MSGKDKRRLLREGLKNAKRGRYDYMFDEEKIRKREERQKEKFDKLNNVDLESCSGNICIDLSKSLNLLSQKIQLDNLCFCSNHIEEILYLIAPSIHRDRSLPKWKRRR